MKTSTLNQVEDSGFYDEFDDIFAIEYESFLIDDESKYDMFEFDDLCSAVACLIASTSEFDSPLASLKIKPLPNSRKHSFLGSNESLLVIATSQLAYLERTRKP